MSYKCYATNEIVSGETRVLVPIEIRKVTYIAQTKPDPRSDYLQFAGQTEGWEIAKEVPVRQSKAEEFQKNNPPTIVGEKQVFIMKPRQVREKFIKASDVDESED